MVKFLKTKYEKQTRFNGDARNGKQSQEKGSNLITMKYPMENVKFTLFDKSR